MYDNSLVDPTKCTMWPVLLIACAVIHSTLPFLSVGCCGGPRKARPKKLDPGESSGSQEELPSDVKIKAAAQSTPNRFARLFSSFSRRKLRSDERYDSQYDGDSEDATQPQTTAVTSTNGEKSRLQQKSSTSTSISWQLVDTTPQPTHVVTPATQSDNVKDAAAGTDPSLTSGVAQASTSNPTPVSMTSSSSMASQSTTGLDRTKLDRSTVQTTVQTTVHSDVSCFDPLLASAYTNQRSSSEAASKRHSLIAEPQARQKNAADTVSVSVGRKKVVIDDKPKKGTLAPDSKPPPTGVKQMKEAVTTGDAKKRKGTFAADKQKTQSPTTNTKQSKNISPDDDKKETTSITLDAPAGYTKRTETTTTTSTRSSVSKQINSAPLSQVKQDLKPAKSNVAPSKTVAHNKEIKSVDVKQSSNRSSKFLIDKGPKDDNVTHNNVNARHVDVLEGRPGVIQASKGQTKGTPNEKKPIDAQKTKEAAATVPSPKITSCRHPKEKFVASKRILCCDPAKCSVWVMTSTSEPDN